MTATAPAFSAGIHQGTRTPLDPAGVDAQGHSHRFDTPEAVEEGVKDVSGRLHAITELVGRQLEQLASVTSTDDRKVIAFEAAATLRAALQSVRAPAEALARAELIAGLDREIQGWIQIAPERRNELLGGPVPPRTLVEASWINERASEAQIPLVQLYTSTAADGTEVRDVYWPSGAFAMSSWVVNAPTSARRWGRPPKA